VPKYLYIFEDYMRQSDEPPTDEDVRHIRHGMLQVLCFADGKFSEFGKDREIPSCQRGTDDEGDYHY
jgi:hypothetical protein